MLLRFNYYLTFKSGHFSWFVVVLRLFLLTKGSQNNILWAQKKFVRYFVWVGDVENYDSCTQCNKCSVLFWHKHKFKSKQNKNLYTMGPRTLYIFKVYTSTIYWENMHFFKFSKWNLVKSLLCMNSYATQRYTYRVLQTIQMKLIHLCVWAKPAVLGSAKTALKLIYKI